MEICPPLVAMFPPGYLWLLIWLTFLGGCVGSFLNVVVYRLPAGKSIVHPGSRCPSCGHAIRWYHNIPVLGWLMLRGRCYDCGARISPRYPLVEALLAFTFLALAHRGPLGSEPIAANENWAGYAYQLLLVSFLLAIGLIEFDGPSPEARRYLRPYFWGMLAAGAFCPLIWTEIRDAFWSRATFFADARVAAVAMGVAGLAAGFLVGTMTRPAHATRDAARRAAWCTVLVGVFLGWQAVLLIAPATAIAAMLVTLVRRKTIRPLWPLLLFAFTLSSLVGRTWLADWFRWSMASPANAGILIAAACGVSLAASLVTWRATRCPTSKPQT